MEFIGDSDACFLLDDTLYFMSGNGADENPAAILSLFKQFAETAVSRHNLDKERIR